MLDARHDEVRITLEHAVARARRNAEGAPASYIPELARVRQDLVSAAIMGIGGKPLLAGDWAVHRFTFQSTAKLLLLAGLLEERGPVEVFACVGAEPSGQDFASVARLETHGPLPANPLVNTGAIALSGLLVGAVGERRNWILGWARKLYGSEIAVDEAVCRSESTTAHRNRAIAYMLKHNSVLTGDVEQALAGYFALCSLCGDVEQAAHLPAVLANGGLSPVTGARILSPRTVAIVVSLMATCGMYNESGNYLVGTGMPAKSGVSGLIVAVVPGVAGIAVSSPLLNDKGGSVRGHAILRYLSRELGWHFALSGAELGAEVEEAERLGSQYPPSETLSR